MHYNGTMKESGSQLTWDRKEEAYELMYRGMEMSVNMKDGDSEGISSFGGLT